MRSVSSLRPLEQAANRVSHKIQIGAIDIFIDGFEPSQCLIAMFGGAGWRDRLIRGFGSLRCGRIGHREAGNSMCEGPGKFVQREGAGE